VSSDCVPVHTRMRRSLDPGAPCLSRLLPIPTVLRAEAGVSASSAQSSSPASAFKTTPSIRSPQSLTTALTWASFPSIASHSQPFLHGRPCADPSSGDGSSRPPHLFRPRLGGIWAPWVRPQAPADSRRGSAAMVSATVGACAALGLASAETPRALRRRCLTPFGTCPEDPVPTRARSRSSPAPTQPAPGDSGPRVPRYFRRLETPLTPSHRWKHRPWH